MKKLLIAGNCVFLCCSILLGVLLYQSYHTKAQEEALPSPAAAVPTTPVVTLTATATPAQALKPWMYKESYDQPFGELPLPVLQKYAEYDATRIRSFLREENPIDTAFAPYWEAPKAMMVENGLASHYRECWEAEALHALDLLAKTYNPRSEKEVSVPPEAAKMLTEFSFITGAFYADTFREGGYGYSGALTSASAAFLRSYTFYLYDLLSSMDVRPDFVFQAKDVQKEWGYLLK